jgi:hypothetical protein
VTEAQHSERPSLLDMMRKRDVLRAELRAHADACVARGPHGYIACQLTRERIEERLARVEEYLERHASADLLG